LKASNPQQAAAELTKASHAVARVAVTLAEAADRFAAAGMLEAEEPEL
jgi:hypothetical protein